MEESGNCVEELTTKNKELEDLENKDQIHGLETQVQQYEVCFWTFEKWDFTKTIENECETPTLLNGWKNEQSRLS